ncbi:MAG: hypothetical protein II468_07360, partial [Lachnospiraceae bacterium]|nr:hypothetical protein [Lachnospiraceae bacterium]
PIFTTKSGGAQATTHLSSPEHPSESFRREVRVANSVLRANDHRDVYNKKTIDKCGKISIMKITYE